MKRHGKSGEAEAEKEENIVEKLRRGVLIGKRGGPSTPNPVVSSWTCHHTIIKEHRPTVSARKLAAALWELHQYYFPFFEMHRPTNNGDPGLRRHRYNLHKDKAPDLSTFFPDASPSSPDQVPQPPFSSVSDLIYALLDWLFKVSGFFQFTVICFFREILDTRS